MKPSREKNDKGIMIKLPGFAFQLEHAVLSSLKLTDWKQYFKHFPFVIYQSFITYICLVLKLYITLNITNSVSIGLL